MPVCSSKHCASSCCVIIIIILFIIIMHCASLESNRSQTIRCQKKSTESGFHERNRNKQIGDKDK